MELMKTMHNKVTALFIGLIMASIPVFSTEARADCDCTQTAVTGVPQIECEALVALYNSTNGAGWWNNQFWNTTSYVGSWGGVLVDDGHISRLFLGWNRLSGSIPAQFTNLVQLNYLDIGFNMIGASNLEVNAFLDAKDPDWQSTQRPAPAAMPWLNLLLD